MQIVINKNLLIPFAIIIGGILTGGILLFPSSQRTNTTLLNQKRGASLRKIDLEIKNMFCLGCRASVVNSIKALPGVIQADADPRTDSGWVIYDPAQISKEQIVAAPIF